MSRPGFPKIRMEDSVVNNAYFRASDGQTFSGTSPVNYRLSLEDAIGANTPGFPANIQDNSYVRFKYERNDQEVNVSGSHSGGDSVSGQWAAQGFDANWDPYHMNAPGLAEAKAALMSRIKHRLISRIQNSSINIAQAIAERDQVARMVGSTARRLAGVLTNLKRGNISAARTALLGSSGRPRGTDDEFRRNYGGIPEQWLALQYGWKPLLSDIDGACKELANLLQQEPPVFRAKASARQSLDSFNTVQRSGSYPLWPGRKWSREGANLKGWGYVEYSIASATGQLLSRSGIINPWLLAWELMPWSFVVDWMLPVGRWLNTIQFDTGLDFKRGWYSWKYEDNWTASLESSTTSSAGWNLSWSGGSSKAKCFYFERELIAGPLSPDLPTFTNPLSLQHMANGLSLLSVTFGGPSGSGPRFR